MKDDRIFVEHILESISDIEAYIKDLDFSTFSKNILIQDAVIRKLLVIGEAGGKLSKEFRKENRNIPWAEIVAMRNKLVHDYMGIDLKIVWETAKNYLQELKKYL